VSGIEITLPASPGLSRGSARTTEFAGLVLADSEVSLLTQGEKIMKVKTNLRAGSGGVAVVKAAKVKSSSLQPPVLVYNFVLNSTRCAGV
jgi:hypothetical protein